MTAGVRGERRLVRFDGFTLDPAGRQLSLGSGTLHLTRKAFDLLVLLVEEAPRVVPKRELHERLWKDVFVADATLAGVVKELRRALNDRPGDRPIIRTVHRVGYAFCRPVDRWTPQPAAATHWVLVDGRRVVLQEGENVIGRGPDVAVCLESPTVSRRHARILVDGPRARLEDLGSKNGTTLGGRSLSADILLQDRDSIEIGPIRLLYRTSAAGLTTETRRHSSATLRE